MPNINNQGISKLILVIFLFILFISFGFSYRFLNFFTAENVKADSDTKSSNVSFSESLGMVSKFITYDPQGKVIFSAYATQYPSYDHPIQMRITAANQDFINTLNKNGIIIEGMDGKKYKLNLQLDNTGELTVLVRLNLKSTKSLEFVDLKPEIVYLESVSDVSKHYWKINDSKTGLDRGPAIEAAVKPPEAYGSAKFVANAWNYPSYDHPIDLTISGNNEFRDTFNANGIIITNTDGSQKKLDLKLDASGNLTTQIVLNLKKTKSIEFIGLKPDITYLESSSFNYWVVNSSKNGLVRGPGKIN